MKKLCVIGYLIVLSFSSYCQNWDEWFRQKKTQKDYLLKQIAALKIYLQFLEKGYEIANHGLTVIRDIKNGDFNLHNNYFNSLKSVNPRVSKYVKVAAIVSMQLQILNESRKLTGGIINKDLFDPAEVKYVKSVCTNILSECDKDIGELVMLITSDQVSMKDDERISRIDNLYRSMEGKFGFMMRFSTETGMFWMKKETELRDVEMSRKIYGVN